MAWLTPTGREVEHHQPRGIFPHWSKPRPDHFDQNVLSYFQDHLKAGLFCRPGFDHLNFEQFIIQATCKKCDSAIFLVFLTSDTRQVKAGNHAGIAQTLQEIMIYTLSIKNPWSLIQSRNFSSFKQLSNSVFLLIVFTAAMTDALWKVRSTEQHDCCWVQLSCCLLSHGCHRVF